MTIGRHLYEVPHKPNLDKIKLITNKGSNRNWAYQEQAQLALIKGPKPRHIKSK